jgi:hypothetical protein
MTGTEIVYDEGGYALTPQGQAWKLWVSGEESATQADRDCFEAFNCEARQEEMLAKIEAEAERTDQENRGIPWTDSPDHYPAGPYRSGPWRTWPSPAAQRDPAAHLQADPEVEA